MPEKTVQFSKYCTVKLGNAQLLLKCLIISVPDYHYYITLRSPTDNDWWH